MAEDEGATHARAFLAHVLGARGAGVASALETAAQRAPLEWRALPTPAHGVALDNGLYASRAATSFAAEGTPRPSSRRRVVTEAVRGVLRRAEVATQQKRHLNLTWFGDGV